MTFANEDWITGVAEPSRESRKRLESFLEDVLRSAADFNLTSITERDDAWVLHVLDSATAVPEIEACRSGPIADIGSGAGFPGVPLAVLTGRPTTLVESSRKKAAFLRRATGRLGGCRIDVAGVRAEELATQHPAGFAAATSRAVAGLATLVELASPLLMDGGRLVAMKGRPSDDELEAGATAGRLVGMRVVSERRLTLPGGAGERTLIAYERSGPAEVRLPRRPGMANKRPLA